MMLPTAKAHTPDTVIRSSLRLLVLAPVTKQNNTSPLGDFLTALTGSKPSPSLTENGGSYSGYTSHPPLQLRNKYYSADVSIWCDELPAPSSPPKVASASAEDDGPLTLETWKEQMCSEAAREVREVIGGIICVLPYDAKRTVKRPVDASVDSDQPHALSETTEEAFRYLDAVNELRETIEDEHPDRELPMVAVLQSHSTSTGAKITQEEMDDAAERMGNDWMASRTAFGWDFVGWDGATNPNVGDAGKGTDQVVKPEIREKTGAKRVVEILELANWTSTSQDTSGEGDEDLQDEDEDESTRPYFTEDGIRLQSHELEREMMSLKLAMRQDEDESQDNEDEDHDTRLDHFESMMERAVAIKEAASEMKGEEKERFAKREVERLVRDMG